MPAWFNRVRTATSEEVSKFIFADQLKTVAKAWDAEFVVSGAWYNWVWPMNARETNTYLVFPQEDAPGEILVSVWTLQFRWGTEPQRTWRSGVYHQIASARYEAGLRPPACYPSWAKIPILPPIPPRPIDAPEPEPED